MAIGSARLRLPPACLPPVRVPSTVTPKSPLHRARPPYPPVRGPVGNGDRSAAKLGPAELMAIADTLATEGLIGAAELDLMSADTVLVNIARGQVVDEQAVIERMRNRRLLGVWRSTSRQRRTAAAVLAAVGAGQRAHFAALRVHPGHRERDDRGAVPRQPQPVSGGNADAQRASARLTATEPKK